MGHFKGTQEEAAAAYDLAAIEYRGANAVTNFDISVYSARLKKMNESLTTDKQTLQPNPISPTEEYHQHHHHEEEEGEEEGNKEEQMLVQPLPLPMDLDLTLPIDVAEMELREAGDEHAQEQPWDIYLDTIEFSPLPIPDIPLDEKAGSGELMDLFDDAGFVDNIDFIFDGPLNDKFDLATATDPDNLFDATTTLGEAVVKEEKVPQGRPR